MVWLPCSWVKSKSQWAVAPPSQTFHFLSFRPAQPPSPPSQERKFVPKPHFSPQMIKENRDRILPACLAFLASALTAATATLKGLLSSTGAAAGSASCPAGPRPTGPGTTATFFSQRPQAIRSARWRRSRACTVCFATFCFRSASTDPQVSDPAHGCLGLFKGWLTTNNHE